MDYIKSAIPPVSHALNGGGYHRAMPHDAYEMWGRRFRVHLREKKSSLRKVAEKMGLAESTLRSWTNNTRQINLSDFFLLCDAAEAEPVTILLGHPAISPEQRALLGRLAVSVLEADPATHGSYRALQDRLRKAKKVK